MTALDLTPWQAVKGAAKLWSPHLIDFPRGQSRVSRGVWYGRIAGTVGDQRPETR